MTTFVHFSWGLFVTKHYLETKSSSSTEGVGTRLNTLSQIIVYGICQQVRLEKHLLRNYVNPLATYDQALLLNELHGRP